MTVVRLCSDDDPMWLRMRHPYLTGSAVATILGKDSFRSKEDLLREKRADEPPGQMSNRYLLMGSAFEEPNRKIFSKLTGLVTKGDNAMFHNEKYPHLAATIDGYITPKDVGIEELAKVAHDPEHAHRQLTKLISVSPDRALLEIKNSDSGKWFQLKEGRNGKTYRDTYKRKSAAVPPEQYSLQCTQQMMVTEEKATLLLAKTGANGYTMFCVTPESPFVDDVLRGQQIFKEEVVNIR